MLSALRDLSLVWAYVFKWGMGDENSWGCAPGCMLAPRLFGMQIAVMQLARSAGEVHGTWQKT